MTACGYFSARARSAGITRPAGRAHGCISRAQPETRIERDLLVAAAAGVDLVRPARRLRLQLADDEGVDVFVGWRPEIVRVSASWRDRVERGDDLLALAGGQNADRVQERARTPASRGFGKDQPPVEMERSREPLEDLRGPVSKRPPQSFMALHFLSKACTLMGSPIRLMKPSASF